MFLFCLLENTVFHTKKTGCSALHWATGLEARGDDVEPAAGHDGFVGEGGGVSGQGEGGLDQSSGVLRRLEGD